ncbi:MAG: iron ABC transporter permease [Lachnospiraceae bacterium]|nr:iron ABC transporter permease [Lachnospiraceae bacterium]
MKTAQSQRARYGLVYATLILLILVLATLNICIGSVSVPVSRIPQILFAGAGETNELNIIFRIRLPRMLMAGLLGGALALAGFLLQTFFANPIAGPFVLGISSGAKMLVALVMVFFLERMGSVSSAVLVIAAFIGALMSTMFILTISRYVKHIAALLVSGIMIGYICSAVTDFIVTFAQDADIVNLHGWSLGSFSGMSMTDVRNAAVVVAVTVLATFLLSKPIGAFQMGEEYAETVGVNVRRFRVLLIGLSSLLAACVTAYAGPISFVGIAVPFLVKQFLKTAKPLVVIPAVYLGGAAVCMGCDLVARTVFSPLELNISTVTSMFGAPVVIYMLIRRQGSRAA